MTQELDEKRMDFLKRDFTQGFIAFCGIEAGEVLEGRFCSYINIKDHHRQQDGFIHAGLLAAMADHTAGYAAFTLVPEGIQILTIEFKINFLRPASGNRLECRSRIIRNGRQIIVGQSEVFDIPAPNAAGLGAQSHGPVNPGAQGPSTASPGSQNLGPAKSGPAKSGAAQNERQVALATVTMTGVAKAKLVGG
ncbi:MAG: PaaI family thioesterase [Desulfatibacillaceae bacterium]|nr:PaaI family thioesterase [Desulfatibacillaceae bacterium]